MSKDTKFEKRKAELLTDGKTPPERIKILKKEFPEKYRPTK